jgi:putative hydrolase of the HAD superfamily
MTEPQDRTSARRLDEAEAWVFDVDNTLYHARYNLFSQIDSRIGQFIAAHLGIEATEARHLQKTYFREHGSTLRGLMSVHGVEADTFLAYVHDIDVTWVPPSDALDRALGALSGRKLAFTNASSEHADRVIARLGIGHHIEAVFDIADADFEPKPAPETYDRFIERHDIDPTRAVMFDDIARNLAPATALGMTTVWVRNDEPYSAHNAEATRIDYETEDLVDWLETYTGPSSSVAADGGANS